MNFFAPVSNLAYSASPSSRFTHTTDGFPPLLSPQSNQAFKAAMEAIPEFLRRQVFGLVAATGAHPAMATAAPRVKTATVRRVKAATAVAAATLKTAAMLH